MFAMSKQPTRYEASDGVLQADLMRTLAGFSSADLEETHTIGTLKHAPIGTNGWPLVIKHSLLEKKP